MKSAWIILSALVAGMLLGIAVETVSPAAGTASLPFIEPIGLLWLNALKMTIVPLIVALLITGITATADAARAGALAGRAVMIFLGAITLSGLMSLLMTPLLLRLFPLSAGAADALRHGLGGTTVAGPSPSFADFLLSLIPTNPIAAAADTAILPLIVFTTIFAFAITKLVPPQRATLSGLFKALGDAMLIVIASPSALNSPDSVARCGGSSLVIAKAKMVVKTISGRIAVSAAAAIGFVGISESRKSPKVGEGPASVVPPSP